jgi:hypothetical protein
VGLVARCAIDLHGDRDDDQFGLGEQGIGGGDGKAEAQGLFDDPGDGADLKPHNAHTAGSGGAGSGVGGLDQIAGDRQLVHSPFSIAQRVLLVLGG